MANILITTMPKSGTHLLTQIIYKCDWLIGPRGSGVLSLLAPAGVIHRKGFAVPKHIEPKYLSIFERRLDNSRSKVVIGHIAYSEITANSLAKRGIRIIQLIRDPRDVIVSHYYSILDRGIRGSDHFDFHFEDGPRLSNREDILEWCIKLSSHWWTGWLPWITNEISELVVRFEDLVGAKRKQAIESIAEIIGDDFSVSDAINRIDKQSPTFRKGVVGEWRHEFSAKHIQLFDKTMTSTMDVLGYN